MSEHICATCKRWTRQRRTHAGVYYPPDHEQWGDCAWDDAKVNPGAHWADGEDYLLTHERFSCASWESGQGKEF